MIQWSLVQHGLALLKGYNSPYEDPRTVRACGKKLFALCSQVDFNPDMMRELGVTREEVFAINHSLDIRRANSYLRLIRRRDQKAAVVLGRMIRNNRIVPEELTMTTAEFAVVAHYL